MLEPMKRGLSIHVPAVYRIELQGAVEQHWVEDLGGMEIQCTSREGEPAVTTLTGELADQAALAGLLNLVYNLGFPLISVTLLGERK